MVEHIVKLSDCVAYVESSFNPLAMRFEPAWQPSQEAVDAITRHAVNGYMDGPTGRVIAATSWGKYQIMGQNLYTTCGYGGTINSYLNDENGVQYETFKKFLASIGFEDGPFNPSNAPFNRRFAIAYNGSPVYSQSLVNAFYALANQ